MSVTQEARPRTAATRHGVGEEGRGKAASPESGLDPREISQRPPGLRVARADLCELMGEKIRVGVPQRRRMLPLEREHETLHLYGLPGAVRAKGAEVLSSDPGHLVLRAPASWTLIALE